MVITTKKHLFKNLLLTTLISISTSACMHDEDTVEAEIDTTTSDTTAPDISSTSPVEAATDISTDAILTATFNEDIFATTIDSSSFIVSTNESISGIVSFDALTNIASFSPTTMLALRAQHTATLTTSITDLVGTPLDSYYSWSFTTVDGSWGDASIIETHSANIDNDGSKVDINDSGNAIATWRSNNGTNVIWVNLYDSIDGWGTEMGVEDLGSDAVYTDATIDSSGNAMVVYTQHDGNFYRQYARYYSVDTGWASSTLIDDNTGNVSRPQVEFDINGNAITLWHQNDGTANTIYANRYVAGSGWSGPVKLENSSSVAENSTLSVNANGDAIALWIQSDGIKNSVWASHFTVTTNWSTATTIETNDVDDCVNPTVKLDKNGNATAAWTQSASMMGVSQLVANYYTVSSGWGTETEIQADSGADPGHQLAMDNSGNSLIIWTNSNSVYSRDFTISGGWSGAVLVESGSTGAYLPEIGMDHSGHAIAVWRQNSNIYANRYIAGAGWGSETLIETGSGASGSVKIKVSGKGQAVAIWRQDAGSKYNLNANHFK